MARQTYETWIPEEYGGAVLQKVAEQSVVESTPGIRIERMGSDTKHVPRAGAATMTTVIAKGQAYPEDVATNDEVLLTALKWGKAVRVAQEDLDDINAVDILTQKRVDLARAYAIAFDNACLGTTAAANGTTVPFTSLYKSLRTTNATTGYTADANRIATAGTGAAVTYANLSNLFALVEAGDYWNDSEALVVAHPSFKARFRGILDSQNRPVFSEYAAQGSPGASSLFGLPIRWSLGARASAAMSESPTGNTLLFVVNPAFLIKGDRSPMESAIAPADSGVGFLTDEALLKVRRRAAFAVAQEQAAAVLEYVP